VRDEAIDRMRRSYRSVHVPPERVVAYENLREAGEAQRAAGPMTRKLNDALAALDRLDREKP
jgi:hypothetical protein